MPFRQANGYMELLHRLDPGVIDRFATRGPGAFGLFERPDWSYISYSDNVHDALMEVAQGKRPEFAGAKFTHWMQEDTTNNIERSKEIMWELPATPKWNRPPQ